MADVTRSQATLLCNDRGRSESERFCGTTGDHIAIIIQQAQTVTAHRSKEVAGYAGQKEVSTQHAEPLKAHRSNDVARYCGPEETAPSVKKHERAV